MTLLSIIGALLVLMVLVTVHELGHFFAGKSLGFRIDEFAIGMGPVLLSSEKDGTRFAVRVLPIGGLCVFHGDDDSASDPSCFNAQPVWKRMLVVLAGPCMNIALAVVISAVILMSYGEYMPSVTGFTESNSPAESAGVREGDIITAVNGKSITYYIECNEMIQQSDPDSIELTVNRNGERLKLTAHDIFDEESGSNKLGIYIYPERLRYGFAGAVAGSVKYTCNIMEEMLKVLGKVFTGGVSSDDVAGPVGTISIIGQAVRAGFEVVLRLGVLISINLGIMNLLPIPALDGGRLLFMVIEAVRGKPIPPEKEGMIHLAGMALLMGLMVLLTVMDVRRLF